MHACERRIHIVHQKTATWGLSGPLTTGKHPNFYNWIILRQPWTRSPSIKVVSFWLHAMLNSHKISLWSYYLRHGCQQSVCDPAQAPQVEHFTLKQFECRELFLYRSKENCFTAKTHKVIIYPESKEEKFYRRWQLVNHSAIQWLLHIISFLVTLGENVVGKIVKIWSSEI